MPPKKVLISPLNWGKGHATRIIPIIRALLSGGHNVSLAINKDLQLIFKAFDTLTFLEDLPGYTIKYNTGKRQWLYLLFQLPSFRKTMKAEHKWLNQFEGKFDLIISDNRYGFYLKKTRSVIITHQLKLKSPILTKLINRKLRKWLSNFEEVWVPDNADGFKLSGELSSPISGFRIKYLGCLSHLELKEIPNKEKGVLVLLSGIEPQRAILENLLIGLLKHKSKDVFLIRGTEEPLNRQAELPFANWLQGEELYNRIQEAEYIVCRSAYSTIMDLSLLGKKVVFIPTPGQTEQEYLAEYFHEKCGIVWLKQDQLKLINENEFWRKISETKPIPKSQAIIFPDLLKKIFSDSEE